MKIRKTKISYIYIYTKHLTTQYPAFTLDMSANSRMLQAIVECFFMDFG